jgi:transglutaminase-like putative cysteine protease
MVFVLLALRSLAHIGQPKEIIRGSRRELVAMRAIILLLSLSVALAATSLVTRYEYSLTSWAVQVLNRKNSHSAEIGFSMDPRLGPVANPEPTMDRILLIDGSQSEQHLRVMAFDTYSQGRWLPTMSDRTYRPAVLSAVAATGQKMHFKRVGDTADLLPLPLEVQEIDAQGPLEEDDLATLRDQQADDNVSYEATVATAPAFQGPLCVSPDATQRQRLLAIPGEIDPKVIELARQIAGVGDKNRQLIRIESTLRSQHAYSLTFNPQGEPLNDFILNNRAAHCQYFASAVVMMARAVGIPARFVSGFYAHERYGSDQMVVRSRDAHAWAECWIDGVGWLTVDATPSGGRPDEIYPDPPAWKRWWEKLTDLPGQIREWANAHVAISKLAIVVAVIVIATGYALRTILRRRRLPRAPSTEYAQPGEELAALRRRFEKWLSTRQIGCPPQLTWSDHLSTARAPAESVQFLRSYNRARFGGDHSSIKQAEKLLNDLEGRI